MSSRLIATFLMLVLASEADAASRYRDIDDWFDIIAVDQDNLWVELGVDFRF